MRLMVAMVHALHPFHVRHFGIDCGFRLRRFFARLRYFQGGHHATEHVVKKMAVECPFACLIGSQQRRDCLARWDDERVLVRQLVQQVQWYLEM